MNSKYLHGIRNLKNVEKLILVEKTSAPYAVRDKKTGAVVFCAHRGNSMHPTLSEHDLLEIEPYGSRPVRRGDVIFFIPPQGETPVVHRVVQVTTEGIRTKGDNSNRVDSWLICPGDVIGRVVWATRGKRRRLIYGGTAGFMWSLGIRELKRVEKCLSVFYHLLTRSGLLRRLVPIHTRMRIVTLPHKGGRALKLFLGHWVIGNYKPGMPYWQIRRPFRLFVDVNSLPR